MIALTLAEIAELTGGRVHGDPSTTVDVVATDSRALPGGAALFVALRGEHGDGHAHVADARAAGAVAALVDRAVEGEGDRVEVADTARALYDLAVAVRRRIAPRAAAVTGSVGKTTVKDLTAAAVGAQRRTVASVGSFNNELGVPLTLLSLQADTEVLVAEIGARRVGDIAELAPAVAPEVAMVTAVAGVHLEIFGTIDAIARAKRELVEALDVDGVAILNGQDPRVRAMASSAPRHLLIGGDDADVTATGVTLDDAARPRFTAHTPWGTTAVRVPVAGRHQVGNALFALTTAAQLGVDLDAAADALGAARISPWRGEVHRVGTMTLLDDAYNANPTSVLAALDTLTALRAAEGRAVAVLGVMAEIGADHADEHRRVGAAAAAAGVELLVVVGPDAAPLAEGARSAGMRAVVEVPDADAAVTVLRERSRPGDVVLVKASRVAGLEAVAATLLADVEAASDRLRGGRT